MSGVVGARPVFHLLTGEWPPAIGGVGDYSQLLAEALITRGCCVHVWCPTVQDSCSPGVQLHRLPDHFGANSRDMLGRAFQTTPGTVLVQYVPNAMGLRGLNVPFCLWLLRIGRRGADIRVMFHEPFFYFERFRLLRNGLAVAQRAMAAALLRASAVVYVSTDTWRAYLSPYGGRGREVIALAIPSTIPVVSDAGATTRWRAAFTGGDPLARIVGHFGTFGDHVAGELTSAVPALLNAHPHAVFVCLGRGSGRFARYLRETCPDLAARIRGTGALSRSELSTALPACDVLVQPYPDGVTTRRTSVMAGLSHGIATVTTTGRLTEPLWAARAGVALAPASDANAIARRTVYLLANDAARRALAARGHALYGSSFSLERTVEALLNGVARAA
ncbi:MAG: glycosyltransferase [Acidobacteria bacterium]|nr:glycosyltransferase [Acidobacteriota bacterium]MCA1649616.1 glycosyltransferase [Acidobacteriota bacterium]